MLLTSKQLEIVRIVATGNPDGSNTDLDEILERASYKPTKQAIQFTIRSLIQHELIEKVGSEKRRGRSRVVIQATPLGKHYANAGVVSVAESILEPVGETWGDLGAESVSVNL